MNRPLAVLVLAPLVVAGLAGCNSKKSDASDASSPAATVPSAAASTPAAADSGSVDKTKPCTLLTNAQISAALGGTVADGTADNSFPTSPRCTWAVTGATATSAPGEVTVFFTGGVNTDTIFGYTKSSIKTNESVSGVGDDAYYSPTLDALAFFKDGQTTTVQATFGNGAGTAALQAAVTSLAKTVAAEI